MMNANFSRAERHEAARVAGVWAALEAAAAAGVTWAASAAAEARERERLAEKWADAMEGATADKARAVAKGAAAWARMADERVATATVAYAAVLAAAMEAK